MADLFFDNLRFRICLVSAEIAQMVEHSHGKGKVPSSILGLSSLVLYASLDEQKQNCDPELWITEIGIHFFVVK
jgi:hypothetical protein